MDENRRATYRSTARRLARLAQDTPELAYASAEKAPSTQTPDEADMTALKRAVRLCMGTSGVSGSFEKQTPIEFPERVDGQ